MKMAEKTNFFRDFSKFYNQNFDVSKVNTQDPNDPLLYENNNSIFIAYANLGLQATYSRAFAGISVADIPLSNSTPVVNGIEPSPTRFYLNAGYDWGNYRRIFGRTFCDDEFEYQFI